MARHRTFNPARVGSSPTAPTNCLSFSFRLLVCFIVQSKFYVRTEV